MRALALALAALTLAGCLAPTSSLAPASADAGALVASGVSFAPGHAFAWKGRELTGASSQRDDTAGAVTCLGLGACPTLEAACEPLSCERTDVDVAGATAFDGRLVVGLRWPSDDRVWMALSIEDASGKRVALGRSILLDHDGAAAILDKPAPGRYHVVVVAHTGKATYEAAAQLVPREAAPAAPRELLPDLVTLAPTDLRIADPPGQFVANSVVLPTNDVAHALGAKGCTADEALNGARKCLRFTNAVANLGEGPLDVALSLEQGATSAAGGRFLQRIARTDGTLAEVVAGPAEFHPIHAHWHNAGTNVFNVYPFDVATKARGAPVAEGRKTGMCFGDVGVADPAWPGLALPRHEAFQCFNPIVDREWSMGLSAGFYDAYTWILNDQYVDLAGLHDGDYLLCSRANAGAFLHELRADNNEGCTAFRLTGDRVQTLDALPYYAAPE